MKEEGLLLWRISHFDNNIYTKFPQQRRLEVVELREFICPSCEIALEKRRHSWGVYWECPSCKGRSSTVSLMRKMVPRHIVNAIWQGVRNVDYPEIRDCPCCPAMMEQIPVDLPSGQIKLDVCPRCQFIWFDFGEYEQLPVDKSKAVDTYELPPEAKGKMALWKIKELEAVRQEQEARQGPDELWKYIPAFLGMPVEVEYESKPIYAWITWGLALAITCVSGIAFRSLKEWVDAYGMIPAEIGRMGGLTILTSFFLHAGPMHLLGNLYYLLVFGDNVEAVLGKFKFLLLIFFATLVGGAAHVIGNPSSTVACIGASGGISGMLAFYAIVFPKTRLGIFVWYFFRAGWARIPAAGFFVFWIILQVWGAFGQVDGIGSVSYLAHLGGVAVGVAFGAGWRMFGVERSASTFS